MITLFDIIIFYLINVQDISFLCIYTRRRPEMSIIYFIQGTCIRKYLF